VIPYVTDQLAMARLPRATFALMLALLPAAATVIGLVILDQVPALQDLLGIGLVIAGVALHQNPLHRVPRPPMPSLNAAARPGPLRAGRDSGNASSGTRAATTRPS
jgi:inner membrane transporter RhtA